MMPSSGLAPLYVPSIEQHEYIDTLEVTNNSIISFLPVIMRIVDCKLLTNVVSPFDIS
jgi:hypothetical protein